MADDADTTTDAATQTDDTTTDAATADAPRLFSQEQVDKIVQDRLARAKSTPPADYEDLKAKAAKLDEIEAESKSELEKAQERATKLEKEAADARELAQRTRVDSAIVAEAAKRGADTDSVVSMLDRSTVELDDNGVPTNIADAVDALLEAKPFLVVGRSRGDADQGARSGGVEQLSRDDLKGMSPTEIVKARQEGRLDKVLGRG